MGAVPGGRIGSRPYIAAVLRLRQLRDFVLSEGVTIPPDQRGHLLLGKLNNLSYGKGGTLPSDEEWCTLEGHLCVLYQSLSPEQRKKYVLRQFPSSVLFIAVAAMILALLAFSGAVYPAALTRIWSFMVQVVFHDAQFQAAPASITLWNFILWNLDLGALGSIAFISVNALSIQADATFDITNTRFVLLRIILGSLFGLMIALPVAYPEFCRFCKAMAEMSDQADTANPGLNAGQVVYLLLPFLIGFSTSLFMSLITRFITAVQSLFGMTEARTLERTIEGDRTVEVVRPATITKSMMG